MYFYINFFFICKGVVVFIFVELVSKFKFFVGKLLMAYLTVCNNNLSSYKL
uniref:Uncharacterized protein n=1 Tax=viral metagenome TaxID=1070528 RepID=A0A6C0AGH0_9ZZZZ